MKMSALLNYRLFKRENLKDKEMAKKCGVYKTKDKKWSDRELKTNLSESSKMQTKDKKWSNRELKTNLSVPSKMQRDS